MAHNGSLCCAAHSSRAKLLMGSARRIVRLGRSSGLEHDVDRISTPCGGKCPGRVDKGQLLAEQIPGTNGHAFIAFCAASSCRRNASLNPRLTPRHKRAGSGLAAPSPRPFDPGPCPPPLCRSKNACVSEARKLALDWLLQRGSGKSTVCDINAEMWDVGAVGPELFASRLPPDEEAFLGQALLEGRRGPAVRAGVISSDLVGPRAGWIEFCWHLVPGVFRDASVNEADALSYQR